MQTVAIFGLASSEVRSRWRCGRPDSPAKSSASAPLPPSGAPWIYSNRRGVAGRAGRSGRGSDLSGAAHRPHPRVASGVESLVRPDALITDCREHEKGDRRAGGRRDLARPVPGRSSDGGPGAVRRGGCRGRAFKGRPYVLTPRADSELETRRRRGISSNGSAGSGLCRSRSTQSGTIRIVAYTSHLPQLASTALASMLDGRQRRKPAFLAPALVDSTRLSLSSFDMWRDILATIGDRFKRPLELHR